MTAPILLAIAAVGGLVLAVGHLRGKTPPKLLAVVHGALAVTGVVFVIMAAMASADPTLGYVALALFGGAAIGGLVLFSQHLGNRPLTRPLIFAHATLAVTGFVVLLVWMLG